MLDLKQMEEAVDALLAKETEESMFNWLLTKRYPGLMEFLGGGTVQELESIATITDKKISPPNYSKTICPVYMPMEQVKNKVLPFSCAGMLTCTVPVSGSNW